MSRYAKNLRSSARSPSTVDLPDSESAAGGGSEAAEEPDDPFYYGWRERWEIDADGSERLRRIPLTYRDLLSPEVGDFIAESTIHRDVTEQLAGILKHRYAGSPDVAVWRDLKIALVIPGLTTGPGPDLCVVEGLEDRDRDRASFRFGEEPGTVRLTVEVVSRRSAQKDYGDILEIYSRIGVEEYVAIRPTGSYADGPFVFDGWRRDPETGRLAPMHPDRRGRLPLRTTGLLLGTGEDGWGLRVWDAETGARLRSPEEEAAWQAERAEQETEHARQEAERAQFEAAKRREAEEGKRKAEEEIERLRARLEQRGD